MRNIVILLFASTVCITLCAEEKPPSSVEKLVRAVPKQAIAFVYARGYEQLKTEVLANPAVRSFSLPVFAAFRRRLLHGWQVFANEAEAVTGVKVEEILERHPGPVLMALMPGPDLRNSFLPLFVADVSNAPDKHRELTDRLLFRVNQLLPGAEHGIDRHDYHGAAVTLLPAPEPGLNLCFAYKNGLFVTGVGQNSVYQALDALDGGENAFSLAADRYFLRALAAARVGNPSLAGYMDLKRVIEHAESLDPDNEETRAMRAFGLDAVTGVMLAEDISSEGVEDRLFACIEDWRGILAPLKATGIEPQNIGRHFPAETVAYLYAFLDFKAMMRAFADGLVRAGQPQQALPINTILLTVSALSAGAGGFPSGKAALGLVRGGGWLLTGAVGLGFSGQMRPLDSLRLLSAAFPAMNAVVGPEPVDVEGGRIAVGRKLGEAPVAPLLLEKSHTVFLSVDPVLLKRIASLKREDSLAALPFFKDLTASVPGSALAAGYMDLPYIIQGLPGLLGSMLTGIRDRVKRQTGFDVLLTPEPDVLFAGWGPAAFALTRADDGLHLRARSPFGLAIPIGGTAAAAALERVRRRSPIEPGAPAGIVPDVAAAPAVDGNPNEPTYAQALECDLGDRAGKVWLLTSAGRLYAAGSVSFTGGEPNAQTTLAVWTGHKAGETRFLLTFAPGKKPLTRYEGLAKMPWLPPVEYKDTVETDKPGAGVFNFEAVIPLAGFMLDPATAACVWRAQVTVGTEGNEAARWSRIDAPGYLILRALRGGMPGNLTEEMILGRGRPTVPLPPAPLPPADVIF